MTTSPFSHESVERFIQWKMEAQYPQNIYQISTSNHLGVPDLPSDHFNVEIHSDMPFSNNDKRSPLESKFDGDFHLIFVTSNCMFTVSKCIW